MPPDAGPRAGERSLRDSGEGLAAKRQPAPAAREHLAATVDSAFDALIGAGIALIRRSDGIILYANPAWDRMFGWERGELVGRHIAVVNAPGAVGPAARAERIVAGLRADGAWRGETHNVRKDGSTFWGWANVSSFEHPEHGPVWMALHTEITDRKRAEDEARRGRAQLQAILDNTPAVVYVKGRDGRYLMTNREHERLFGIAAREIVGMTDLDFLPTDVAERLRANDRRVLARETPLEIEEEVPVRGRTETYLSVKFPLRDEAGEAYALCGISTNISERKHAEEQRLRRLVVVGSSVLAQLEPEPLLERIVEAARELTGARYAALGVLAPGGRSLERLVTSGMSEEVKRAIGELPRGRGLLGEVIVNPTPLRLAEVSEHPRSYGFPPGHPEMHSFLAVPIAIRGRVFGNLYLTEKRGGEFSDQDEDSALTLATWAGVAIENAQLYSRLDDRRAQLVRALHQVDAAMAISRALGGETDLRRVLDLIVRRARELVAARALVVLLWREDGLAVAAAAGEVGEQLIGFAVGSDDAAVGEVLRAGAPRRLDGPEERCELLTALGARSALLVPLAFRGRVLGVLAACDRSGEPAAFDDDDEALMQGLASSAATAVATAESFREEGFRQRVDAAEKERAHWARELHDDALQRLGAVRFGLAAARRAGAPDALERAVDRAVGEVEASIAELRRLIAELRPAPLDELGLTGALEELSRRADVRGAPAVHGRFALERPDGAPVRIRPELERTVYRLVQEALSNVEKHAAARRAEVDVALHDGFIRITVEDDGRGFDPQSARRGFGLAGMRERVELVGGSLEVSSRPGAGTRLSASIPV